MYRRECRPSAVSLISACLFIIMLATVAAVMPVYAAESPVPGAPGRPVVATNGMAASQHHLATLAGVEVLREGGNAIDAAVTIGFTLAVTHPAAGNLGGGGFMIIHTADGGTVALDYRERAPFAATRDMFIGGDGAPDPELSLHSHRAAGVPGSVAGMCMALERWGTISLERALRPAIEYAENGFTVDGWMAATMAGKRDRFAANPAAAAIFLKPDGTTYGEGERFVQKDLARSLRLIAGAGAEAFYRGDIARLIADDMARNGGLVTTADLETYRPVPREPVRGVYRGYDVCSMPPSSSGGVHLVQMLNILEGFDLGALGHNTPRTIHLVAETMRRAYADRSKYLGDTDFVDVPIAGLVSKDYAAGLRRTIETGRATPSTDIGPGDPYRHESDNTTHFSVMDGYGNAVSCTTTLNFSYGSCIVAEGTGILLNNEMDDFSAQPGAPNAYGLTGGEANAIEPGKRMLSCMTPTIVLRDGRPWLVTGTPGGSRIITTTLQIVLNVIDHGMNIAEATEAVRIHHQWLPDELRVEPGLPAETVVALESMGHTVVERGTMCITQSVMHEGGVFLGAADPRGSSSLAAGY